MTDYAVLLRGLRAHGMSDPVVRLCADALEALQAECERLRAKVEVAEAGYQSAVSKAQWQASTNAELNRLIRQRNDLGVENERLRAELAAAQNDTHELLQQLRYIRTHLYAATVQRSPTDDKIIAGHIEQAYTRANEVIKAQEKRDGV